MHNRQLRKIFGARHPREFQNARNEHIEYFKDAPVWKNHQGKRYGNVLLPVPQGFKEEVVEIDDDEEEEA